MDRHVNMTSLGDDALETLTIAGLEKANWNRTYDSKLFKTGQCCVQVRTSILEVHIAQPTPMEVDAVVSTCACCGRSGHEKPQCRFRNSKCNNCGKTGHLKKMCKQREKFVNKSSPSNSCNKSSGKNSANCGNTVKCNCCGQVCHRRLDCPHKYETCSRCGKRGHLSQACRSHSGGNSNARAVEVSDEPEDEECKEIQHVWTLSVCKADGVINSGNVLNMIVDSGAEEHVVSVDDWRRLGAPVLKLVQIRLRSATGDDMGVSGSFVVRGCCDDKVLEMTALVSTRASRSLCSARPMPSFSPP